MNFNDIKADSVKAFFVKERGNGVFSLRLEVADGKNAFAYFGIPQKKAPHAGWPALVLAHGGNGSADIDWVRKSVAEGFVAIAPDLNGKMYDDSGTLTDNPCGGPHGYGGFSEPLCSSSEIRKSWVWFSVATLIACRFFLQSREEVNKNKIGIEGISWGGVLSLIACGYDPAFSAAVIFYASGYLQYALGSVREGFLGLTNEQREFYLQNYDPAASLPEIRCPILFVSDARDDCFSVISRSKTAGASGGSTYFSYIDLVHGHAQAVGCEQPVVFFKRVMDSRSWVGGRLYKEKTDVFYEGLAPAVKAFYATGTEKTSNLWVWRECVFGFSGDRVKICIPADAEAVYVQFVAEGTVFSTDIMMLRE